MNGEKRHKYHKKMVREQISRKNFVRLVKSRWSLDGIAYPYHHFKHKNHRKKRNAHWRSIYRMMRKQHDRLDMR